jgi:hypothetical protein
MYFYEREIIAMINVHRKLQHYLQGTHAIDGIGPALISCNLYASKIANNQCAFHSNYDIFHVIQECKAA